jgi:hypothetical protein
MIRVLTLRALGFSTALSMLTVVGAAAQQSPPAAGQPAAGKPATGKPATGKPATGKPAPTGTTAGPKAGGPSGAGQPMQLASFGDWGAYASDTAKGKVCYALSQPRERIPAGLNRDPGFLFISSRPSEGIRNEVSVVTGFPTKDGGDGEITIAGASFALVTKGNSAWMKNAAEDPSLVEAMKKGQTLVLKTTSRKGNANTDRYSLSGFAQALERVRKDCP